MDKDALIVHALQALQASIQGDKELTKENACVSVVGVGQDWEIIDDAAIQPFLDQVEVADADAGAAGAGAGDEEGKAMDETA